MIRRLLSRIVFRKCWVSVSARTLDCGRETCLYADDTIQHAGVVVGFGGIAGHTFIGLHKAENSYFHRAMCAQDYSAVTACMMTKSRCSIKWAGFRRSGRGF